MYLFQIILKCPAYNNKVVYCFVQYLFICMGATSHPPVFSFNAKHVDTNVFSPQEPNKAFRK